MRTIGENDLEEMKDLLQEILRWIRFMGWQDVKQVLEETLKTESERLIYQQSDGKSTIEIAKIAKVSHVTVYTYWQKWAAKGIVKPYEGYKGRYERAFSLEDFGIEVPKLNQKEGSV